MDLDDSFTERLLQKNKARRQFKTAKENEYTDTTVKKRQALLEENQIIHEETSDKMPEESPKRPFEDVLEDSPKRQCLGSPSRQWPPQKFKVDKENTHLKENISEKVELFKVSQNPKGLAALRKKHDLDSGIVSSGLTSHAEVNTCQTYVFSTNSNELCTGRKTRLANLAADINQWEDDLHKPTLSTNKVIPQFKASNNPSSSHTNASHDLDSGPKLKLKSTDDRNFSEGALASIKCKLQSPSKKDFKRADGPDSKSVKATWEKAISATLETEEIKKSSVKSIKSATLLDEKRELKKINDGFKSDTFSSIQSIQHRFKLPSNEDDALNKSFEPAELPLSARRALFERGGLGQIGKTKEHSFEPKLSVAQRAALFESTSQKSSGSNFVSSYKSKNICTPPNLSPSKPSKIANLDVKSSPLKSMSTTEREIPLPVVPIKQSPIKKINADTHAVEEMLLARVNSKIDMKETADKPEGEIKGRANLAQYWEKLSGSSKSGNSYSDEELVARNEVTESDMYESADEPDGYESETESKYERESESEYNSNTEVTEEYSESDNESEYPVEENVFKSPKGFPPYAASASKECQSNKKFAVESSSSCQEDNYIDDSCDATSLSDGSSYAESTVSTDVRSIGTCQSVASSCSSVGSSYDPESSKESEENFKSSRGSVSDTPLLYTVSFYRKQKQETRTPPPLKSIVRREQVMTPPVDNQAESIQEQIKIYQEEILKQQTIIGQTSQALNLCHATAEFSGSSEQVEGERLLLIATQKRQALLNEIQRLKAHGAEGALMSEGTGTLTISDLQLPLKQEFLAAQLEGRINDAVHWFLCLIRYGSQVIVTQMVTTDDKLSNGALCFTNHIKLQNLPPDFSIVFEVYALQTKKENLSHDKKYHIKRDKSTLRLASKGKKSDGKLLLPAITSPGGPNAVRSPSFGVIGFTRFTIQNCNKKCFTLDKVPFSSPLDGVLKISLHLHAEHRVMEKGFLTMFEDVSGFGAWHRRWCVLNAQHLTYWKYPDDEHKKEPIGAIDLKQCVTGFVKPVSRDVCARPHTFQLVTVRPQKEGDKNTLISHCANTLTTTKHLLSADTKEERVLWCDKLNEALSNVRKWDPQALRPVETSL